MLSADCICNLEPLTADTWTDSRPRVMVIRGDSRKFCEGFLHATCQDLLTKQRKVNLPRSLAHLPTNTPNSMNTVIMQAHIVVISPNSAHFISAPPTITNTAISLLQNFD